MRETLRQIGSLPRLEKLRLTGKSVDDGGVAQIAGLSSLRSLELYDNGITAAAGRSLARLHGLRFLDISRPNADLQPPLTDAILKDLALLPELEELNMQGARVRDEGLAALGEFPRLRKLDLTWSVVSFGGRARAVQLSKRGVAEFVWLQGGRRPNRPCNLQLSEFEKPRFDGDGD